MERGVRPIRHPGDMPMLDWIEVDVIDMRLQIVVVADQVLPIASLPQAAFGFRQAPLRAAFSRWYRARESRLDVPPSRRDVQVALGHGPDAMQVIRQDDACGHREWACRPRLAKSIAQQVDVVD